jgi:hypothetical protein
MIICPAASSSPCGPVNNDVDGARVETGGIGLWCSIGQSGWKRCASTALGRTSGVVTRRDDRPSDPPLP